MKVAALVLRRASDIPSCLLGGVHGIRGILAHTANGVGTAPHKAYDGNEPEYAGDDAGMHGVASLGWMRRSARDKCR